MRKKSFAPRNSPPDDVNEFMEVDGFVFRDGELQEEGKLPRSNSRLSC
jgi:hypothetical protein